MGYPEYISLLLSAPWLYVAAIAIAFMIYALFLRRQIESVFDPLLLNMFSAAIGAATVIFLLFTGNISSENFYQYVLTEICFLVGLTMFPLRLGKLALRDELLGRDSSRRHFQCIYLVSALTFLVAQPLVYLLNGIPIFLDSRLDYYAGGSGLGMFSRVISVSSYFCWYLLLHKYTYKWKIPFLPRFFDGFLVACLVVSAVLSGSKSGLLVILFLSFYFRALHGNSSHYPKAADRSLRKMQRTAFGAAVCGALLVIVISGAATSLMASLGALTVRIVSSGDVYFMAYPGDNLHYVDASHPLLAIFGSTLSMFRLIEPASGQPLGMQIFHIAVDSTLDQGPNPRHNVFGLVYFGYLGSVVYSSFLGLFAGFVRNVLLRIVRLGGLSELIYVYVAMQVISINADVELVVSALDSFLLIAPIIFGVAFLLEAGTRVSIASPSRSNALASEN